MTLTQTDANLYYKLWLSLLEYVNKKYKLKPHIKNMPTAKALNTDEVIEIADKLWENVSVIDEYLAANSSSLSDEEKSIVAGWKNRVRGRFILERHLKKGSIFINTDTDEVYQVSGIISSWEEMLWMYDIPVLISATLIPFKDVVISDGLVRVMPIIMGSGIKKMAKDSYMNAKNAGRIIRSLGRDEKQDEEQTVEQGDIITKSKNISKTETKAELKTEIKAESKTESKAKSKTKSKTAVRKVASVKKQDKTKTVNKYTFKVYPRGRGKTAYRVLEMPGSATLDDLCEFILEAFDFTHEHLYEFCMDNKMYSENSYEYEPMYGRPSTRIKIDKLDLYKGQKFSLHYDYGDDWMFVINVQKIEVANGTVKRSIIQSKGEVEQYPMWDDEDYE